MRRDLSLLIQLEEFNARNRLGLLQSFSYNQQTYPALVSNVKLNGFHLPLSFLLWIAADLGTSAACDRKPEPAGFKSSHWDQFSHQLLENLYIDLGEIYKLIDLRDRVIPHSDATAQSMVRAIDFNTYGPVFIINISDEREPVMWDRNRVDILIFSSPGQLLIFCRKFEIVSLSRNGLMINLLFQTFRQDFVEFEIEILTWLTDLEYPIAFWQQGLNNLNAGWLRSYT